ncbi:MAG: hypothetical protein RLZZ396_104, partial [Planctomycetota bacterium]
CSLFIESIVESIVESKKPAFQTRTHTVVAPYREQAMVLWLDCTDFNESACRTGYRFSKVPQEGSLCMGKN